MNFLSGGKINPLIGGRWSYIIPTIMGILVFARLTKYRWISRYSTAILSGIGLGVTFGETIKNSDIGKHS
jgi:hypothetical protein